MATVSVPTRGGASRGSRVVIRGDSGGARHPRLGVESLRVEGRGSNSELWVLPPASPAGAEHGERGQVRVHGDGPVFPAPPIPSTASTHTHPNKNNNRTVGFSNECFRGFLALSKHNPTRIYYTLLAFVCRAWAYPAWSGFQVQLGPSPTAQVGGPGSVTVGQVPTQRSQSPWSKVGLVQKPAGSAACPGGSAPLPEHRAASGLQSLSPRLPDLPVLR